MASLPVVSLPLPLLLLVHLYILDYPNVNDPEYGPDLFNPRVRGLRDRTRSMEDIFYFLVGCLEGGKAGAKTVCSSNTVDQQALIMTLERRSCLHILVHNHQTQSPFGPPYPSTSNLFDMEAYTVPLQGAPHQPSEATGRERNRLWQQRGGGGTLSCARPSWRNVPVKSERVVGLSMVSLTIFKPSSFLLAVVGLKGF